MNRSQRLAMAIAVAGGVSAVGAAPVIADAYTYAYFGNNYTNFYGGNGYGANAFGTAPCYRTNGGCPPTESWVGTPNSPNNRIIITLTYSAPLPNNSITSLSPLDYSFSGNIFDITPDDDAYVSFSLQTNQSGNIIAWDISAFSPAFIGPFPWDVDYSSYSGSDTVSTSYQDFTATHPHQVLGPTP